MARRIVIFGWVDSVHVQRWAAGLTERGYKVKVISLGGEPLPGIDTVIFPRKGRFSYFRHASAAAREARAFKPDLVHVHYAAGFGHWGLKTAHTPTVISTWGSDILVSGRNPVYRYFIGRALRHAAAVTASSDFLCSASVQLAPETAAKCIVIPFGVDIPDNPAPLPSGPLKILYLKRHRAVYGPDLLLKAVAAVSAKGVTLRVTMAGDGPLTDTLKRQAVELGIDDCVCFPGLVPHHEVFRLIGEHHLLAMPSRSESFGVAALEAAACGRPTVAARVGGVPEVIEDGVSGILVAPESVEELADAIVRLTADRDKLAAMGRAARQLVERRFRWANSLDLMTDLYERLLS
jgi:glycosyltransferase involved in cell wall biosynthesis